MKTSESMEMTTKIITPHLVADTELVKREHLKTNFQ